MDTDVSFEEDCPQCGGYLRIEIKPVSYPSASLDNPKENEWIEDSDVSVQCLNCDFFEVSIAGA